MELEVVNSPFNIRLEETQTSSSSFIMLIDFFKKCNKSADFYLCYGDSERSLAYCSWREVSSNNGKIQGIWRENFQQASQAYSKDWQQWVYLYTMESPFYRTINGVLREFNEADIAKYSHEIKALRFALQCASNDAVFPTNLTLYRKLHLPNIEKMIKEFKAYKNLPILFPGFTSTSSKDDVFDGPNKNCVLIFHYMNPSEEHEFIPPLSIKEYSQFKHEEEYLIPCFQMFRIEKVQEEVVFANKIRKLVVDLEIFPFNLYRAKPHFIWFDPNINNKENKTYQNVFKEKLKSIKNPIEHFYENMELVISKLQIFEADKQSSIIVSCGSQGENLLQRILDFSQIKYFFLFCMDIARHEHWFQQRHVNGNITNRPEEIINYTINAFKQIKANQMKTTIKFLGWMKDACMPPIMYEINNIEKEITLALKRLRESTNFLKKLFGNPVTPFVDDFKVQIQELGKKIREMQGYYMELIKKFVRNFLNLLQAQVIEEIQAIKRAEKWASRFEIVLTSLAGMLALFTAIGASSASSMTIPVVGWIAAGVLATTGGGAKIYMVNKKLNELELEIPRCFEETRMNVMRDFEAMNQVILKYIQAD